MANITAKTSSNVFYQARCNAATHNEQLSSREGAADYAYVILRLRIVQDTKLIWNYQLERQFLTKWAYPMMK